MRTYTKTQAGFTLIELSIVLVIIGLIVGGVLVGQDLIRAAEVRATISQIEKYNTAVNTFRGKYNALPGDMNNSTALQFGFSARGANTGQGDGNGLIEGVQSTSAYTNLGFVIMGGETAMFWIDLSKQGLIDGGFSQSSIILAPPASVSITQIANYLPAAKLGRGNYIYVWNGGYKELSVGNPNYTDGINYFGLSAIMDSSAGWALYNGEPATNTALTVQQAYNIDKKMDDGFPQSGRVTAMYASYVIWAAGGSVDPTYGQANSGAYSSVTYGAVTQVGDETNGVDGTASGTINTCYDASQGLPERYSLEINNGANVNCALSFQFQ